MFSLSQRAVAGPQIWRLALARFERACGAIGRAAVKLAEEVDACIEFELTRRRVGFYKDMQSEQSIKQPTDMPTDKPKEQSMNTHYDKVKPNVSEMVTLEGAHSVCKDIILECGDKQTKYTSVATRCWQRGRTSFGWCVRISPYDRAQVGAFPCSRWQGKKPSVGR